MLTALLAMLRELIPFFKESILQGRSFSDWLKDNVFTFAWLCSSMIFLVIITHQADLIIQVRQRENAHLNQLEQIKPPLEKLIAMYRQKSEENEEMKGQLQQLLDLHDKLTEEHTARTEWMDKCGIVYRPNGQCPVPRRVVVRAKPATPAASPQPAHHEEQEPKTGFLQRIRNIFKHKKDES